MGILPLCNAVYFTQVPIAPLTQEGESLPLGKLFSMKLFWVFALLMVAAGACEQAMSQWASAFAESGVGVLQGGGGPGGPLHVLGADGPFPGGLRQVGRPPEPAQL